MSVPKIPSERDIRLPHPRNTLPNLEEHKEADGSAPGSQLLQQNEDILTRPPTLVMITNPQGDNFRMDSMPVEEEEDEMKLSVEPPRRTPGVPSGKSISEKSHEIISNMGAVSIGNRSQTTSTHSTKYSKRSGGSNRSEDTGMLGM